NASGQTCFCPNRKPRSAQRKKVRELLISSREYGHLCWRTNHQIFRADGQEAHVVTEASGNTACPSLKLRPRPLETMVTMTELASRKRFPFHVVFAVRRR